MNARRLHRRNSRSATEFVHGITIRRPIPDCRATSAGTPVRSCALSDVTFFPTAMRAKASRTRIGFIRFASKAANCGDRIPIPMSKSRSKPGSLTWKLPEEASVKLVLFQPSAGNETLPGLLTERGVVDISPVVRKSYTPQLVMQGIIDDFDTLRPALEKLARDGAATRVESVRLRPPLPRPGKILACIANYWEHAQREPRPLNMFMKNPDAVIGPGDTIVLPDFTVPWIFMHEAELALVIKGPAKMVKAKGWKSAVFGYTTMIDVSAREQGRRTWPATPLTSWLGKSFDTFAPI